KNRRGARLSEGWTSSWSRKDLENNMLLRRQRPQGSGCLKDRASCRPRIYPETGRRNRRGLPCRFQENGRCAGVPLVRQTEHVQERTLQISGSARNKRSLYAKDNLARLNRIDEQEICKSHAGAKRTLL